MGGMGSGRYTRSDAKPTVEGVRHLDVNDCKRQGCLYPGVFVVARWKTFQVELTCEDERTLVLSFPVGSGEERKTATQRVHLMWSACHLGGVRPWFVCPHCGRRAVKLYKYYRPFLCRRCCGFGYVSQKQRPDLRLLRQSQKIDRRFGGTGSVLDPFPPKPKGMHWTTYERWEGKALILRYRGLKLNAQRWGIEV